MEKIGSFKIDHTKLHRGIYLSKVQSVSHSGVYISTFDIRVKEPNSGDFLDPSASHTIEHICATYFRNEAYFSNDVVYFGPMGCLTGFYLVLASGTGGYYSVNDIFDEVMRAFNEVSKWKDNIPGATITECGNYKFHNIELARAAAKEYTEYLLENRKNKAIREYPGKLGIVLAMDAEKSIFEPVYGEIEGAEVLVSGIGKVNAALAAQKLINEYGCDNIVSIGFAGGISENGVNTNDIVIADSTAYGDVWCGGEADFGKIDGMPKVYECEISETVKFIAEKMSRGENEVKIGPVVTCDRFVTNVDEPLKSVSTALAVDMEFAAIAQVCYKNNVKFSAVKLVSDSIGDKKQFDQYEDSKKLCS